MPQITANITKANIYHIAEGISTMISQHNGGTPSYELLWASPDEAKKLDIYYREAISDLERHLTDWIDASASQYDLTGNAGDYSLVLNISKYWPARLKGLLDNKIQDYLVHAVTAGWLNDFQGLEVKQDYQAMATQDISDIVSIIMMRSFGFQESQRGDDNDEKPDGDFSAPEERKADSDVKPEDGGLTPEERKADSDVKPEDGGLTPEERKADSDKPQPSLRPEAGFRRRDNVIKMSNDDIPPYCRPKNLRHRDNDVVEHHEDWTDWSGTGIAYGMRPLPGERRTCETPPHPMPKAGSITKQASARIHHGKGYTPSRFEERPIRPVCHPAEPHPLKPNPKDPRIPDNPTHPNYPPIKANGIGWSDDAWYDAEGSEHYIND